MKADNDQPKELSYCQTAALAVLRLKQQLQHEYERAHPELRDVIPAILDQEEKNAWNLSSFPHLLVPDLVEARMAKLSLQTEGANDPAAAGKFFLKCSSGNSGDKGINQSTNNETQRIITKRNPQSSFSSMAHRCGRDHSGNR